MEHLQAACRGLDGAGELADGNAWRKTEKLQGTELSEVQGGRMKPTQKARALEIFEHYGLESQFGQLTEKCAELIKAVSKF